MSKRSHQIPLLIALLLVLGLAACGSVAPVPPPPATPTPEILSVQASPQPYPQIIHQLPLAGERLGLTPTLKITFDRAMNQAQTSAAWSFLDADGKPVAGQAAWTDGQTFQFKPDRPLTAGTAYSGVFAAEAASVDGKNLPEEIRLDYKTTNELQVGQVFPADQAENVDRQSAITVIFNKPVIPLMTREEQAKLAAPITIQPSVAGTGNWVSSSVYMFQPQDGLSSGTDYQVVVQHNLKDTTGTALKADFAWRFSTNAPSVTDFALKEVGKNFSNTIDSILLDQAFLVTFNQPMEQASLAMDVALKNVETGADFPVKLTWNKASTALTITPVGRYTIASFYNLTIAATAKAQDGGRLGAPYQVKLATVPLPRVASVLPASGKSERFSGTASVFFASPMKFESMKDKVKVIPAPQKPVQLVYEEGQNVLNIIGLEPSTNYVIRLLPGMSDIYGNTIPNEYSFSFETAGLSPRAQMATPYYPLIYRTKGEKGLFFQYTNINAAKLTLYNLSFDELAALLYGKTSLDDLNVTGKTSVREIQPELKAGKDHFARILLNLDDPQPLAPGYYYVGLTADPLQPQNHFLQGAIFIVADDNLTLKATQNEALAWLVDSESGQPVANVPLIFYDGEWNVVGQASTDKDGLAHIKNVTNVQAVRTDDSAHLAMATLNWGSGVNEGQFGIWADYWTPIVSTFAYVYTERPLYRPNQPVYIKGILRTNDDLHYSLPAQQQVYLSIENDQGKVLGGNVSLSADGTFASQYDLGADAPVGNYYINVRETADSDNILGSTYFRVAEYVKPEFSVTASAVPETALVGDQVKLGLEASYYSGGALSNATVDWYTEAHPYFYQPPETYSNYSFNDFDYYDYYYNGNSSTSGPPIINQGTGQTDENGHFETLQTMTLSKEGVSEQVAFSANVTDVGGNLVGSSTQLTVLGSAIHAGIRPEDYIGEIGKPATFHLVVLDMNGKPLNKQTVSVTFAEQRWFSVIRKDENGVARWESSVKSIPAGSASAVTDVNGLAVVQFTPPNGGEFKATATAKDDQGRAVKASSYLWVWSEAYIPWRQTNDRSFQLVADKDAYTAGETAKILIAQPFEGENEALITIERGHIYEKKVVKLSSNSTVYEVPITGDMAPVMYFSVMVVKGADGKTPPDFKIGMVRLNINPAQQRIIVSVKSDQEMARPGDTVAYTVTTKDLRGQPVKADVSLALVDKAVLALAPSNNLPLLDAFYPQRGLGVMTASSIVLNAEDFNANYQETAPTGEGAGSGGGKGAGETGIITVRQNFKDTAFWQAQVLTDENGTAQVKVTLPDNLTTWQMAARAITDDTRVGEATSELLSTRPLQIQLQTPRFFVVDDTAELGAVIHNNTDSPLNVKVTLQAEGLTLQSAAEQTISVAAKQQAYVTWQVAVARGAQRVDLTASAESGGYTDATKPTLGTLPGQGLPVLSYHVTETVGTSGFLREAGSTTEIVTLPKSLDYLDASLNLEVSPSLAASMVDGLTYLNDYPYLCMEQTVSRFLPNLIALEALKLAGKSSGDLQKSLDAQVTPALQRINNNQNSDGGWGLWPGSQSSPTTTAYVILGLVEARQAGYTVSDMVLSNGMSYLDQNMPYSSTSTERWQQNQVAFMLYALARGGQPNDSRATMLYAYRANLDLYAKALLMQAMYSSNPQDERVQQLLSDVNSAAAKSAAGAWWNETATDYWNWNTDLRSTAIVLNALIQVDPQNTLIPEGIRWLMKHRQGNHWYSTQETAWSLMTLNNWLSLSKEFETNYQFALGLNENLLASKLASADKLTETTTLRLGVEKLLADTANYLVITRGAGPGVLYYTAYMDYSLPVKEVAALDQGILVSRQYFRPTDLKTPVTEIERGELVQVKLTLVVPESLHYVVIDDPLPAGLEAIDASLQTSQQVPTSYQPNDYDRYGWGWWYFYYKQIYDEKVVMSADYLPAGTYTITYLARGSVAGTFNVLPATAKEFYFPDVAGRNAGSIFVVK
jgi:alpha-2-macroglobulin